MTYPFLKGHGTENDFVLLPDHDGTCTATSTPSACARCATAAPGIGGRRRDAGGPHRAPTARRGRARRAEWFMDYRNADGSVSEMCGNGIRVFARHLRRRGPGDASRCAIGTRAGVKTLTGDGDLITVDLGRPSVLGETKVAVGDRSWPAAHVDMGNPHAVAFVDDLADAGPLLERARRTTRRVYPTASTSSSSYAAASGTSRCGCTSAARARPGPAAPAPAP